MRLFSLAYSFICCAAESQFFRSDWLSSSFSARPHFKVSDQPMKRESLALVTTSGLSHGPELDHMDGGMGAMHWRLRRGCRWGTADTQPRTSCSFHRRQFSKAGPGGYSAFVVPLPHWPIMESLKCHLQELGVLPDGMFICF